MAMLPGKSVALTSESVPACAALSRDLEPARFMTTSVSEMRTA
ncbi:hypothetical protein [Roseburia intestinalis]|nr:hypothetical protein [Roseburia intestinalis]